MIKQPKPQKWQAKDWSKQQIADYKPFNFVDGEGVRCSLYVSGCLFACPGCYNKVAQSFAYGFPYTEELEQQILTDLAQPYVQGLTLLGGEPFLNTQVCLRLTRRIREVFGSTKDIWSWTGYTWETLQLETADKLALLNEIDVLVDGPYQQEKRNLNLRFRGSENQRIIDVPTSLNKQKIVLWAGTEGEKDN